MRRLLSGLALVLALALAIGAILAAPPSPSTTITERAAVNFALNYSDPASDVFQMWTSNNSHVTDASGYWVMHSWPGTVNILRISSADALANVSVYLKVQTSISVLANTTYQWRLYTRADNATHYILTFRDGFTSLVSNHTGAATVNLTTATTVGNQGWLGVYVPKSDLGGTSSITAWNIDASTRQVQGNYTYEDFGWSLPGNPGSAPAFLQGRVTDAADGAALSGVNVSTGAAGYFTTTNATGYYSLPAAPGTFNLTFTLSGYDSQTKQVTVNYQQTQTVNAALSKTSSLSSALPWIVLLVVVVAAALVAIVILRRRKKPAPPKQE